MGSVVISKQDGKRAQLLEGRCRIQPVAPYDLSLAARFFAQRSASKDEDSSAANYEKLKLTTVINSSPVVIEAVNSGTIAEPHLKVCWRELEWSDSFEPTGDKRITTLSVTRYLRRVLSLDVDLKVFYQKLNKHQQLKSLRKSLCGLKPSLTPSSFDAAIWAIVGQQVTLGFALTLKERLSVTFGRRFSCEGAEMFAVPTARALAEADVDALRSLQLSQRKSEYVLTLARAVTEGTIDLEALQSDPYELACEKLVALRGIGQWTANYVLMRGAGHLDALPLGDAGLRRAVRSVYGFDKPPTDDEIAECAELFRPHRSLFTLYLWQGYA